MVRPEPETGGENYGKIWPVPVGSGFTTLPLTTKVRRNRSRRNNRTNMHNCPVLSLSLGIDLSQETMYHLKNNTFFPFL